MKVKVGLREYNIKKQYELVGSYGEILGKHDLGKSEIVIADKFDQLQQNETFLHEILHAICLMQDLTEINDNEHYIELLSVGLHRVIAENPHIFKMKNI